jgi:type I restriction enzyme S subunit
MSKSRVAERSAAYALQTAVEPAFGTSFDLLATAPQGVAKLRSLVLSLAVQGRLTAREGHDDSAGALGSRLRDIRSKAEPSRGQRRDPQNVEDDFEKPCALPCGWAWIRLSELGDFRSGKTPSTSRSEYWNGSYPWVSPKDMKELIITSTQDWVTEKALEDGLSLVPENSVLVVVRSGILRRMVPVAVTGVPCTVNQDIKALCLLVPEMARYVQLMIQGFESFILDRLTKIGTTVESIKFDEFARQPFPLPPLAEQARIVARVEELMRLCDALEAHGRLQDEQHARLVATLFDALATSASAEELAENWQRIVAHFDLLLDRPEAVDALEQTLLQLAGRGLLVPQDPSDEPASELLRRIQVRKVSLPVGASNGRQVASRGEPAFNLPMGWEAVGLLDVCAVGGGATPSKGNPSYWDGDIPWVSPKDMKVDLIGDSQDHVSPKALSETRLPLVSKNSLLVVVRGMILVHSFPVAVTTREVTLNQDMKSFTPYLDGLTDFLALALKGFKPEVLSLVARSTHGTCKLESEKLFGFTFGLPPIAEQHRIVARVEQLRRLCADLRERLQQARATQSRLADALGSAAAQSPTC